MKECVVALEVAEQDFERFVEMMDLDLDTKEMTDDDEKAFNRQRNRLIKSITNGSLVIDDEGIPTYTPRRSANKDAITFFEPDGSTLLSTDRKTSNQRVGMLYVSMAEMTKTTPARFSKMKAPDLKVCTAIYTLFLD